MVTIAQLLRRASAWLSDSGPKIAIVITPLLVLTALFGGCVIDFVDGSGQSKDAAKVVEKFMQLMLTHRPQAAESLFATRRGDPDNVHEQLQALNQAPGYVWFDGYRALAVDGYKVQRTQYCILNSHTIALRGTVSYDDGSQAKFDATLTTDEGEWELVRINVNVPPSKTSK